MFHFYVLNPHTYTRSCTNSRFAVGPEGSISMTDKNKIITVLVIKGWSIGNGKAKLTEFVLDLEEK